MKNIIKQIKFFIEYIIVLLLFLFLSWNESINESSISAKKRYDLDDNFYNSCFDCMADM